MPCRDMFFGPLAGTLHCKAHTFLTETNDHNPEQTMSTTASKLLKWELRWIPVELVMTCFGLFLLLRMRFPEAGAYFLFLTVALSFVVRITHYCSIGHRHTDNAS